MAHIPRVYQPGRVVPGRLALGPDVTRHLTTVLRMRAGEEFLLFPGDGSEWRVRLDSVTGRQGATATVLDLVRQAPPDPLEIVLCCALIRASRFETAVEKCTEIGVDVIRPLTSEHTNRGDALSPSRRERLERIAVEAAEQSGRLRVPVIAETVSFDTVAGRTGGPFVIADAGGKGWTAAEALLPDGGTLAVLVGPEGGWSESEVAQAKAAGGIVLRLGDNILRTETAAMAALTLLRART